MYLDINTMFFSKAQELEVTEVENYSVKTPTDSEAHNSPSNVLRNFFANVKSVVTNLAKQPAENSEQKIAVEEEEDDDEDNTVLDFSSGSAQETKYKGLANFITNVAKVIKLIVTKLVKKLAENAVEEEDYDEDNTVLDFSSGTAQETESTGR